jgi:nitrous oxidase accessory protein NosD
MSDVLTVPDQSSNRRGWGRRGFLRRGGTAALIGLTGLAGTATGQSQCDVLVDASGNGDATSVQAGVDMADPGDVVCVDDGTYTESVHVAKELTLTNAPGASPTIELPSSPPTYGTPESGNVFETVLFVGPETGASTVEVDVSGLRIDGNDQQPGASVGVGVLVRNTTGRLEGLTIERMAVGGKQTGGIAVYGDTDVDVHHNTVDRYERFGIAANGDGGAHPSPTADIRGNHVTGSGDGSGTA